MKLWISETPCVSTSNSIAVENGTGSDEAAIPFSPLDGDMSGTSDMGVLMLGSQWEARGNSASW